MSEARANRLKNQTGTASALINPLPVKRGNKDYMKENLAKLREATAANVAKKTVAEPVKDLFKLDKFKDVQSVVFQNVDFTVPAAKVCVVWASPACVVLQVWCARLIAWATDPKYLFSLPFMFLTSYDTVWCVHDGNACWTPAH